jgi:signal recognition particle receptor subunit beta
LREVATRLDPTQTYDVLPIELGEVQGVRTRLQIVAVPGGPEQAPTRKALLDRADGIVFVIDSQRERIDENVAALEELRTSLHAYGRSLESVPLVLQYNKRDRSDPSALEELHRKLAVPGAAAFEAVAQDGAGVLQALTTISKRVIRARRDRAAAAAARAAAPAPAPAPARPLAPAQPPSPAPARRPTPDLSQAATVAIAVAVPPEAEEIVHTAERVLDASWQEVTGRLHAEAVAEADAEAEVLADEVPLVTPSAEAAPRGGLVIRSVGQATRVGPRAVRLPLVLHDDAGRELQLALTVQLDPLLTPPPRGRP